MTFTKSILLGTSAVLMGAVAAQAADLPSRKSAPVEYVRVCDAYGAGFFFIPGTQTCLRIGGRVRADYAFVPAKKLYSGKTAAGLPIVSQDTDGQHTLGWEARGRISFDARTQTSWGTLQAVALLRMSRVTGILSAATGNTSGSTGSTLEAAYIRFAGFTFGAAADNFRYMPGLLYGAAHWASFGNGAKQISYTATFGGGLAATIALQDYQDTGGNYTRNATGLGAAPYYVHNSVPHIVGKLQWTQGWGNIAIMGAVARPNFANNVVDAAIADPTARALAAFDKSTTVWAVGTGVTINLPMLARGSALYLTANYANGMTEYTTRYTSFSSAAFRRDVGGFQFNHPSVVLTQNDVTGVDRIDTVKSWNVAAMLRHFWTPQYRSIFFASYGSLDAPAIAKTASFTDGGFGDATVWNVGTQFAWLPTSGFEIGVEVIYSRVSQDVRYENALGALVNKKESDGNFTGRLRVERNF